MQKKFNEENNKNLKREKIMKKKEINLLLLVFVLINCWNIFQVTEQIG